MNARRNHPRGVLLDLLNDMVARLDDLLGQLATDIDQFRHELRVDPSQCSRSLPAGSHPMADPTDTRSLSRLTTTGDSPPRTAHQLLLELHQMHARLAEIIRELESREGLG